MLMDIQSGLNDVFDIENREVSMSVMSDPFIYEAELDKLWPKIWVLLGHESEIPSSGDYMVRDIGEDQVIVSRDRKDEINVVLNACAHRGMRVCMAEQGNAKAFKCIYHGWAFRQDGSFIGAPVEKEQMHGDIRKKSELGLKKARVCVYTGFIFATWNHEGPSFEEYMGDFKFYWDMIFARTDDGMECLGPPQRSLIKANWKTAGDGV